MHQQLSKKRKKREWWHKRKNKTKEGRKEPSRLVRKKLQLRNKKEGCKIQGINERKRERKKERKKRKEKKQGRQR